MKIDLLKEKVLKVVDGLCTVLGAENIIYGKDLDQKFHHVWKMDEPLKALALVMPKTTKQVSEIIKTRLNIHFGDPNKYRGLDSNIWSMLEDKKSYPVVTLHHANLNLDSGDIIFQAKSNKKFEEMTLKEFIKFEIEGAKICLSKALEINENTPIDSKFKNRGTYKTAMNSIEKKQAFQNLIPS